VAVNIRRSTNGQDLVLSRYPSGEKLTFPKKELPKLIEELQAIEAEDVVAELKRLLK